MAPIECPTCGHENASSLDEPAVFCERCRSAVTPPPPIAEELHHEMTMLDIFACDDE